MALTPPTWSPHRTAHGAGFADGTTITSAIGRHAWFVVSCSVAMLAMRHRTGGPA